MTTVEAVRAILSPALAQSVTDEEIAACIRDAAAIVSQYSFWRTGVASADSTGALVDKTARFLDWVQPGAMVKNLSSGTDTTVKTVPGNTQLTLDDTDFVFQAGQRYTIEDLVSRERAERYKAASLLFAKFSPQATGWESVRLGPASLSTGNWWSRDDITLGNNIYEAEYRKIVDYDLGLP